jgi:hypothetical protein
MPKAFDPRLKVIEKIRHASMSNFGVNFFIS